MTNLLYLENTYLYNSNAVIKKIDFLDGRQYIILNQTIFYPQGGGQPADKGIISTYQFEFEVNDVRINDYGEVLHFGQIIKGKFENVIEVELNIDMERRILNARLHSAGHLLDCAVEKLNIESLKPTKGYHFPDSPYVEYEGKLEDKETFLPLLNQTINALVKEDLKIIKKELSSQEAKEKGMWAPQGKSVRIVNFNDFTPCGCGGTHINSSIEIGQIVVRKIKSKKGKTRISYQIDL